MENSASFGVLFFFKFVHYLIFILKYIKVNLKLSSLAYLLWFFSYSWYNYVFYLRFICMKKYLSLTSIFVVLFGVFCPGFLYINAEEQPKPQPAACGWPSEMMSLYFDFQHEVISMLLWSSINERRFSTAMWNWWLFTNQILYLSGTTSALDLVSSSVLWGVESLFSATVTSVAILLLASASAIWSNTNWLAILFKDRPIVRDYRQLLDIESELFDVAYFRSKQVDLTKTITWDLWQGYTDIVKNYQDAWLLEKWTGNPSWWWSMLDILWDLVWMNTAMKVFLTQWWQMWKSALKSYRWCMWNKKQNPDCSAVLLFSDKAINQLSEDYAWLWYYWACNQLASNVNATNAKTSENTEKSSDTAEEKFKKWVEKLKKLFAGVGSAQDHFGKWEEKGRCNMSEYQMAQLKAYYWNDWTCDNSWAWGWVNVKFSAPSQFTESKVSLEGEKKNETSLLKEIGSMYYHAKTSNKLNDAVFDFIDAQNTRERSQAFFNLYGSWYTYSAEFDPAFLEELTEIYTSTNAAISQSQWDAIASDMSYQLIEIKWLLGEVDKAMEKAQGFKVPLQGIADSQCSEW